MDIPRDIIKLITDYLVEKDIFSFSHTCKYFHEHLMKIYPTLGMTYNIYDAARHDKIHSFKRYDKIHKFGKCLVATRVRGVISLIKSKRLASYAALCFEESGNYKSMLLEKLLELHMFDEIIVKDISLLVPEKMIKRFIVDNNFEAIKFIYERIPNAFNSDKCPINLIARNDNVPIFELYYPSFERKHLVSIVYTLFSFNAVKIIEQTYIYPYLIETVGHFYEKYTPDHILSDEMCRILIKNNNDRYTLRHMIKQYNYHVIELIRSRNDEWTNEIISHITEESDCNEYDITINDTYSDHEFATGRTYN